MGNVQPFHRCTTPNIKPQNTTPPPCINSGFFSKLSPLKRSDTLSRLNVTQPKNMRFADAWQHAKPIGTGTFCLTKQLGEAALSTGQEHHLLDFTLGKMIALDLIAPLDHPNVMRPLGLTRSENAQNMIVSADEYCGTDLQTHLEHGDFHLALDHALQMGKGLAALHEKGIVHRNVKPNSFMISEAGNTIKLGDFGSATPINPKTSLEVEQLLDKLENTVGDLEIPPTEFDPNTDLSEDPIKNRLFDKLDTSRGVSAIDFTSPALVHPMQPVSFGKSDDIFSFAVTLLELSLAAPPEYEAHQQLDLEAPASPLALTRYVQNLHQERMESLSQAISQAEEGKPHALRNAQGDCLSKPFMSLLKDMLSNATQPDNTRVNEINHYLERLAALGTDGLFYQPNDTNNASKCVRFSKQ